MRFTGPASRSGRAGLATWGSATHGNVTRLRIIAIVVVLAAGLVTITPWRWSPGSVGDSVFVVLVCLWWSLPFIAVAAAIADGNSTWMSTVAALAVGIGGTIEVPRWVQSSIEDDPSSTAVLIHVYDPLLVALAVGVIFGIDFMIRRALSRGGGNG
jgi:hypothetical protein